MLSRRTAKFAAPSIPPGENIEYVGLAIAHTATSPGNKSETITVPAGATFAAIGFGYYTGEAQGILINSLSLDGQPGTEIEAMENNQNYGSVSFWHASGFSEGNVLLSFNQAFVSSYAPVIGILFYKNVNGSPVRDSNIQALPGPTAGVVNIPLTALLGDLMVGFMVSLDTGNMDRNNQITRIVSEPNLGGNRLYLNAAEKPANSDNDIEGFGQYICLAAASFIKA